MNKEIINQMKKRIVILGAGESGAGAAVLAKAKGFDVFVSDFSSIKPSPRGRKFRRRSVSTSRRNPSVRDRRS